VPELVVESLLLKESQAYGPFVVTSGAPPFLSATLQIILELCIPEKELAKTRSQI
jgi:hypothetical protein